MRLPDRLVVWQVDTHRGHRRRLACFYNDVDGAGRDATHAVFAVLGIPGHVVFEPLRGGGDLADVLRLVPVDVIDERFPGALDAARVHVDLDEAVDRIDGRVFVVYPRDVVGDAIGVFARAVERHERAQ